MRTKLSLRLFTLALALWSPAAGAEAPSPRALPETPIPQSFGVNTHIDDGDVARHIPELQKIGVGWIRQDLDWGDVEKHKGVYNFSSYDRLFNAFTDAHIRIMAIVDYDNPNYDRGLSPYTPQGREAFGRFAEAAAKRYADKKIVWEIYNEPNIETWRPKPDVEAYLLLAETLTAALKRGDPNAIVVGPALSGPWPSIGQGLLRNWKFHSYLKRVLESKVVHQWSAFTLHPYRDVYATPESAGKQLETIRELMQERGLTIPVIAGEWGYSTFSKGIDEDTQAAYAVRSLLWASMQHMPFSIWYDWQDDGTDVTNKEHRFGLLRASRPGAALEEKPSFAAVQKIGKELRGYRFSRMEPSEPRVMIARFVKKGAPDAFALWSIDNKLRDNVRSPAGCPPLTVGMMPVVIFAEQSPLPLPGFAEATPGLETQSAVARESAGGIGEEHELNYSSK
jgi:polysaccharide biosynthesis protein PslG